MASRELYVAPERLAGLVCGECGRPGSGAQMATETPRDGERGVLWCCGQCKSIYFKPDGDAPQRTIRKGGALMGACHIHQPQVVEVGRYAAVSGRRSKIVYAIDWCPVCRGILTRTVGFYDGIRWGDAEYEAAKEQERVDIAAIRRKIAEHRDAATRETP